MVRDLLLERAAVERGEQVERCSLGELGPSHDVCPVDCCLNPRTPLPTVAGVGDDAATATACWPRSC
jgi:ferrochelatase